MKKIPRKVKPWQGRTDDAMPPPLVRLRIFEAYDGHCYNCGVKLRSGHWSLEHIHPLWDGGENSEDNLAPTCPGCEKPKTAMEATQRAEGKRHRAKQAGIKKRTKKIPYRRFDGTMVWPE